MHKVKAEFNKFGRFWDPPRPKRRQSTMPRQEGANGSAISNEGDPLLPHNDSDESNSDPKPDPRWHLEDERVHVRIPMTVLYLTWKTLSQNIVNVLLVFVPLGIIAGEAGWSSTAIFTLNFFAIIPLASLLSFATEQIAHHLGETLGGLLNATFGNAVELIVSIVALQKNEIRVVQASMLGSILSNVLLVLGCCFLAGGIRRKEQRFNVTVASTMSSLMAVASTSLVIPATLYAVLQGSKQSSDDSILLLSHGTSIILLLLYCLYLYFQLFSHSHLFDAEKARAERLREERADPELAGSEQDDDEEEKEEIILGTIPAAIALLVVTVIIAICAEYLVGSIEGIVEKAHISKTFVGLVLIPIVGNAAEHVTAVFVAYRNKMDLAINVAIGSSIQIALFVTPFMVILGWIMGVNMTLHFQLFETTVFFLSVLVVNYLIQDGRSNYLEGAMCMVIYCIIALAFYVYPDDATDPTSIGRVLTGQ